VSRYLDNVFFPDLTIAYQKLPCTFELEVPGLGILEGNPGEDVGKDTPGEEHRI
jgi:hypothetical protein